MSLSVSSIMQKCWQSNKIKSPVLEPNYFLSTLIVSSQSHKNWKSMILSRYKNLKQNNCYRSEIRSCVCVRVKINKRSFESEPFCVWILSRYHIYNICNWKPYKAFKNLFHWTRNTAPQNTQHCCWSLQYFVLFQIQHMWVETLQFLS